MNAITYDERKAVYQEAIERYGVNHQLNKFDEELGEFLAEYGRMRNGEGDRDKFAEELGDLSIMLEQMRLIFGVNDLVCEHMDMKIRRLMDRLSKCDDISAAIRHFEHGISHDIFSEPVTSFARVAIDALKEYRKGREQNPLTCEDLLKRIGKPVWVRFPDGSGHWWIVTYDNKLERDFFGPGSKEEYGEAWIAFDSEV